MEEENKETKKKKTIWKILITISIIIAIAFTITIINNKKDNDKSYYTIQYISIEDKETYIYVNFEIESETEFKIKASEFSVMINGIPVSANSIYLGTSGTMTPSGYISSDIVGNDKNVKKESIKIKFEKNQNELDKPITFLYKGTILTLGTKIEFEH